MRGRDRCPRNRLLLGSIFGESRYEGNLRRSSTRNGPNQPKWWLGPGIEMAREEPATLKDETFLGGGLFGHGLSTKQCDLIVIQMDADNLSDDAFRIYIKNQFDKDVVDSDGPIERGNEVRSILETVGDFDELVKVDRDRHLVAPAVESTETWCVAAFERQGNDPELLRGQDLCIAFMEALHRSENRSIREFAEIDKSANRRLRFCRTHSAGVGRLERQCHHYRELVNRVNQVRHHAKGH